MWGQGAGVAVPCPLSICPFLLHPLELAASRPTGEALVFPSDQACVKPTELLLQSHGQSSSCQTMLLSPFGFSSRTKAHNCVLGGCELP